MGSIIHNVDAAVIGLGSGGAMALSKLDHLGITAANGHAIVGLDAGTRIDARRNVVVEWAHVRDMREAHVTGTPPPPSSGASVVGIGSFVNQLRHSLAEREVPMRFDTAITGVERLRDGRLQFAIEGSNELYRTKYLINGTAGKLPNAEDFGLALAGRSEQRRQDFLISIWENPNAVRGQFMDVAPSARGGDARRSVVTLGGHDHAQIATYLRRGEQPSDREQRTIIAQAARSAAGRDSQGDPVVLGSLVQTQIVPVRGATANSYAVPGMFNIGESIDKFHPESGAGLNLAAVDGSYAASAIAASIRQPSAAAAERASYVAHVDRLHAKPREISAKGFAQY